MKTFLEFMKEDNSAKIKELRKSAADFGKEVDFQKQKLTTKPTPLPKPTGVEKIGSNDILSGSRYSDGIVTDQDKSTRQIQKQLRKDYQQPPGFGTPSYDKARDKIDIEFKKNLPGLPDSNVPAEAVPGSIRPQYIDPMKTSPAVPVPIPKPKAKPPEIDQRVPRPKMRPDKQGPIQRVKIKWPKEIQDRVPKSDVIPSGPGITTPGSMIYIEPKQQKLQDRVPQQKIQDRVPQQKIQDRVPPSAVNPKPTSAGPYAPAQSDDPFHQRYAKTASYLGQGPRDRKPSEKKEPIQNLYQINKGDTLEKISRKIGGKNWQQTLKDIRNKNPKIKERALKIGSELLLPENAKPITSRIKQDQTYVPQSAINPPSSVAGPFITGVPGASKNAYNYKVPGLLDKNITVATKQQEPSSMVPKPKLRPRISDDEAFIAAVRDQESRNNPKAISPKGAAGLMQVMPDTGAEIARDLEDKNYPKNKRARQKYLQDPKVSDTYGRHYLNKLYVQAGKDIGFNDEEKLRKATLAGYNAGFGGSRKYRESLKAGKENPKLLPKETRNYVPSILSKYEKNKLAKDTSTQKKPETPETNTDNTKGAVAIPKPDSVGINVKPSKKAPETFAQAFKNAPEGSKFTWKNKKYLRKTKK